VLREGSQRNAWNGKAFKAIFEHSRLPMMLIDAERRYVAVNDATLQFYGCTREELIGSEPGRTLAPHEQAVAAAEWNELVTTGEYYGERVFDRADGRSVRIQYAANTSTVNGRWLAFSVVLSAHVEPDGPELVVPVPTNGAESPAPDAGQTRLTPREREVVRLVALGASSREVAADLYLSPETVRSHVRNAMSKTHSRTRAQLVAIALAEGLIEE
jgi:PAS domain S-box-containing protein